ncbi:MAG: flagellar hook assembly protein FlgD [Eubacteriales bacterium]
MAEVTNNMTMDQYMLKLLKVTDKNATSKSMQQELNLQTADWMKLLVAQLKNQDLYNQTDSTEMTKQMAQYSQIQAVQNMVKMQENIFAMNSTAYAASLIGKDVTVAEVKTEQTSKETKNTIVRTTGKVTGVALYEGTPHIYIGDKKFALNQIMIVGEVPKAQENKKPEDGKPAGNKTEGVENKDKKSEETQKPEEKTPQEGNKPETGTTNP